MLGKQNQPQLKRVGRVRLDHFVNGLPKVHDLRMLLSEAQKTRGTLCELLIRAPKGGFLLSCQSDGLSSEPCWTLFQGEEGTQQVWSYMDSNIDMLTDIVVMSVTDSGKSSTDLRSLRPSGNADESADKSAVTTPSTAGASESDPFANSPYSSSNTGGWNNASPSGSASGWGAAFAGSGSSSWGSAKPLASSQNFGSPSSPSSPESPFASSPGFGSAQASPFAPSPGFGSPQESPFASSAQSPFTASQNELSSASPQIDPFGAPSPPPAPYMAPQQTSPFVPQQPAPHTAQPASAPNMPPQDRSFNSSQSASSASPAVSGVNGFLSFLEQNKHLTIGELVFNANLPPNCVDAAMRLQELVCKNTIDERTAREAIKLAAQGSGVIDENVLANAKTRAADNPDELVRKAAGILQQAGLITEGDVSNAESSASKTGGAIGDCLVASGKIDKLLLENAQKCHIHISKGNMRPDQAIIALHYCSRMRAPLEDALSDLSIEVT